MRMANVCFNILFPEQFINSQLPFQVISFSHPHTAAAAQTVFHISLKNSSAQLPWNFLALFKSFSADYFHNLRPSPPSPTHNTYYTRFTEHIEENK